ncbi:MAG: metal ABC transporter permease [Candidatus Omnitrophica bacterium]|nr:metal ABC transporter permease [Candidatus Omnitrophota bacterium]
MVEFFQNYTIQIVFTGSLILGITAGCLGTFAVLRQQSLLGDAIAHATLPGVCLAFLITQTKNPFVLLLGAGISGWIASLFLKLIVENTKLKKDAALGIILSVFFGLGLLLITIVQKLPTATKAGLDKFIFGNAATLLKQDVMMMSAFSIFIFLVLIVFWKEFKLLVFDRDYAASQGMPVHFFDVFLTTLIVITIVIGLQTVGVVLMSAMLVAPAAAARQWTDRLGVMLFLSALFGAISGTFGAITSSMVSNLPTGPTIVIFLSIFVLVSLVFAPNRGLLWDWIRSYRSRKTILTTTMLQNLLLFSEIQTDPFHPHDIAALKAIGRGAIDKTMKELSRKGWAKQFEDKRWALTPKGLDKARKLTKEYEDSIGGLSSA